jgi:hypothetical protein
MLTTKTYIYDIDSNVKQNIPTQDNNYADTKKHIMCVCVRVCVKTKHIQIILSYICCNRTTYVDTGFLKINAEDMLCRILYMHYTCTIHAHH